MANDEAAVAPAGPVRQGSTPPREGAPVKPAKDAKPAKPARKRREAPAAAQGAGAPAKGAASKPPKQGKAKKRIAVRSKDAAKDKEGADAAKQGKAKPKKRKRDQKSEPKAPFTVRMFFARLVPLLCVAVAFVGLCVIFRFAFPPITAASDSSDTSSAGAVVQGDAAVQARPSYLGVEDRWVTSGYFTTGDKNLDAKVKKFCDDLTVENTNASGNALNVYNNIMWNYSYVDRGQSAKPAGPNWDTACARDFFSRYEAAGALGGEADYYELAAATAQCLRYFGYSDALAVPVLIGSGGESTVDAAYCLVTDENGSSRICDPTMGASGWMTDRYAHTFMVDDIGQDLTAVEAMGLQIMRSSGSGADASSNASGNVSSNASDSQDATSTPEDAQTSAETTVETTVEQTTSQPASEQSFAEESPLF